MNSHITLFLVVAGLLLLSLSSSSVSADVRCRTGEFAHSCPSEMPVCCYDSLGYSTGCCRMFTLCTPDGDCDPGPGVPNHTEPTSLESIDAVVHLSWESLGLTLGCAVLTLLLMVLFVFASGQFRSYMARRRVELRAQQLREAGLFGEDGENGEGGAGDGENGLTSGYEADVWEVTSDDEREYRQTVLSSEHATIQHVLATNKDGQGVMGRVSAWFGSNTHKSPSASDAATAGGGGAGALLTPKNSGNNNNNNKNHHSSETHSLLNNHDALSSSRHAGDGTNMSSTSSVRLAGVETASNVTGGGGANPSYGTLSALNNNNNDKSLNDGNSMKPLAVARKNSSTINVGGGNNKKNHHNNNKKKGGVDDDDLTSASISANQTPTNNVSAQQQPQPRVPSPDPTERYLLANCSLCKIRLSNCSLLPCTHSDLCEDCAKHMKRCPECKSIIKKRVKIFMA